MDGSIAKDYRGLLAWRFGMDLVEKVYQLSQDWPTAEQFGLTNQIRRASVLVPSNIAEGQGRYSPAEFARFLGIAHGSLREVETQLLIAGRLGYLDASDLQIALALAAETGRCIQGLLRKVRTQIEKK